MRTDTPTLDAPGRAPGAATDDELRELDSGLDALQAVDSTRRTGLAGWDWSRVLLPVAAVVLLVAIWQAFAWLAGARGEPITGPGDVVGAFGTLWAQGLVQQAVATSVGRAVVGFALAVVVGVGLGLVLGQVGVLRRAFGPLLTALMVLPNVAWVPLAVLWFGLSDATAYLVMLTGAVPAVVAGLTTGTDQVPPQLRRAARVLGAEGKVAEAVKLWQAIADDPSSPLADEARVRLGELTVQPGTSINFLPEDIHSIHVVGNEPTLHFHLYGQPLETLSGRIGVEPETGRVVNYNATQFKPSEVAA